MLVMFVSTCGLYITNLRMQSYFLNRRKNPQESIDEKVRKKHIDKNLCFLNRSEPAVKSYM